MAKEVEKVFIKILKPIANYVKGDTVEVPKKELDLLDELTETYFAEDPGARYKVVDNPEKKAAAPAATRNRGGNKPAETPAAPAAGNTPPAAGAGASE